ncbi:MAG: glycine betaine/L-proline ABC transporter substrate-binding protein ProX [Cyanobacteriota bacterium]|nr:glycine betaine/L-proline ABC transporter substrate-binding protein ProX [Cyanobacteriota bacterium]
MAKEKRTVLTLVTALLFVAIACQSTPQAPRESEAKTSAGLPGRGVSVRSANSGLLEVQFINEIVNIGLEKLGYKIEKPKAVDYTVMLIAIANGDLDYTPEHVEKLHKTFFEKAGGEQNLQRVGTVYSPFLQGYKIDKKTADKYNITNLQQLQDPEIAKLFDSDGDGKANLTGCDPGWGCELVIEHQLDTYGLRDTVEHDRGKYTALIADTIARYRQGESILYHAWTPYWVASVLKEGEDAVWLEVPFTSLPEAQGKTTKEDTSVEGKNLGFAVDRVRVVANEAFLQANPAAKRWFELFEIPTEDINAESLRIHNGEDRPEEIRSHALEWVKNNQEQFDRWLEEASKAGKGDTGSRD